MPAAGKPKVSVVRPSRRGPRAGAAPQVAWTPERVGELLRRLKRMYPEARCSLEHHDPFQLLVATILSAQCTDERVNKVTPGLFARFPTPSAFSGAERGEIEKAVKSTGFFRSKARAIQECSRDLVEKHGGKVPRTMEELTALRGVGRKTANVVLGNAYGIPGVVVDTHVGRLSRRLALSAHDDPARVEQDLVALIPRRDWTLLAHLLIHHGRAVCTARKPHCSRCRLAELCPRVGVTVSD